MYCTLHMSRAENELFPLRVKLHSQPEAQKPSEQSEQMQMSCMKVSPQQVQNAFKPWENAKTEPLQIYTHTHGDKWASVNLSISVCQIQKGWCVRVPYLHLYARVHHYAIRKSNSSDGFQKSMWWSRFPPESEIGFLLLVFLLNTLTLFLTPCMWWNLISQLI